MRLLSSQRQCEAKYRPAAGTIFSPYAASVGSDNCPADGQSQPDAAAGSRAPHKLFKYPLFTAVRNSRPAVRQFNEQGIFPDHGRKRQRGALRRVPEGIVKQVHKDLFDKERVKGYQG
jgi:hypothetical protein